MSESERKADFSYLDLKPEDRVHELLRAFAANVQIPGEQAGSRSSLFFCSYSTANTPFCLPQEWSQTLFPHLAVRSVAPDAPNPSVTFSFAVQPQHCNFFQNLRVYFPNSPPP